MPEVIKSENTKQAKRKKDTSSDNVYASKWYLPNGKIPHKCKVATKKNICNLLNLRKHLNANSKT